MKIKLKPNEVIRVKDINGHTTSYYYAEKIIYEITENIQGYKVFEVSVLDSKGFKEYIHGVVLSDYEIGVIADL